MPWCPECGIEYRDGFETCSDCGCKLSETPVRLEPDPETSEEEEGGYDREAFLVMAENSIEADMIEGLLNENEIPVLKKYSDAGDYMKIFAGSVNSDVGLFVPSHLLEKAKEILAANQGSIDIPDITEEELEAQALAAEPVDGDPEDEDSEDEDFEDGEEVYEIGEGEEDREEEAAPEDSSGAEDADGKEDEGE